MKNNGRAKKVEDVVDAVMDALESREGKPEETVEAAKGEATEAAGDAVEAATDGTTAAAEASGSKVAAAAEKLREADIVDKVDRVLTLIEENAALFAAIARRWGGEAAKQAPSVASAVGEAATGAAGAASHAVEAAAPAVTAAGEAASETAEAIGEAASEAAEALGEAAGRAIEAIGEELVQPATRYGRGLRHGLVFGAVIAILFTPWPGRIVREKLMGAAQEAADLIGALREGAGADTSDF